MLRQPSKVNKAGVLIEPANPYSAQIFFKTANDWEHLSGYVGSFPDEPIQSKTKTEPSFRTKRLEISHSTHESKVKTALNYLFLRDLGCSQEDAFAYTVRKTSTSRDLVNSLPPNLRKDFRLKLCKTRCIPCRPPEVYENFEHVSDAFKELIFKKKKYFDSNWTEQEKYLQKVAKEAKSLKNFKTNPCPSPEFILKKPIILQKVVKSPKTLVVVPEVPALELKESKEKPPQKKIIDLVRLKEKSNKLNHSKSGDQFISSEHPVKFECSSPESEGIDFNFPEMINEEKKLIELVRVQKLKNLQMRGEESKKNFLMNKKRKVDLEMKFSEEREKEFEKKKEKIRNALMRKQNNLEKKIKNYYG